MINGQFSGYLDSCASHHVTQECGSGTGRTPDHHRMPPKQISLQRVQAPGAEALIVSQQVRELEQAPMMASVSRSQIPVFPND